MARSRNIKPGLCKNEVLADLGPMTQLLFAMLPTLADREGRMEDRPRRIKVELFPYYEADVDAMLQSLADCDEQFIVRYEIDGKRYLQITNFEKHQAPHHKESDSTIPAPSMQEPCLAQASTKHDDPGAHAPVKGIRNQQSGIKDQESARPDPFDEFWELVHLKKGKQGARTAYARAVKRLRHEQPDRDAEAFLRERMAAFAASPEADPPDRAPIHPATWLNDGRYDDDPATWQARAGPANAPTKREVETAKFLARHKNGDRGMRGGECEPALRGVRPPPRLSGN